MPHTVERRRTMTQLNDNVMTSILERLPAESFAAAACISKDWNRITSKILSRPKLISALSLNPSLTNAVKEILDKLLSKPFCPHFAIAFISDEFCLRLAHMLIAERLKRILLVVHVSHGIMGKDVVSDEQKEVKWDYNEFIGDPRNNNSLCNRNQGILLVLGFVPGLKVDAIPLFHPHQDPDVDSVDEFLADIRQFSAAASGNLSPDAIMMFGNHRSDMNSVVAKLDHVFPKETIMIGDTGGCFMFNSNNYPITTPNHYMLDAVALVFTQDQNKSHDIGNTNFHLVMTHGLIPIGPTCRVHEVRRNKCTDMSVLRARMQGSHLDLVIEAVFQTIRVTVTDPRFEIYIGATQRRGEEESLIFYKIVSWGEGTTFVVQGIGLKPGDTFLCYHTHLDFATISREIACENLEMLKHISEECGSEVFGGMIFSSRFRGKDFFMVENFDVTPFSDTFPGAEVVGAFSKGEIGRGFSNFVFDTDDEEEEEEEVISTHFSLHAFSAIYLAMSYTPPSTAVDD